MNKTVFSFATLPLTIFLLMATSIQAQNWSREQIEVLDTVKKGWNLWQEAVEKNDHSIWLDGFPLADDWKMWFTSEGALWDKEAELRSWDYYLKSVTGFAVSNIQPLSIQVFDDMALIYFSVSFYSEDTEGKWNRGEEKRLEVYKKENGKWTFAGGMVDGTIQ